jgi:hypothetical protein
MGVVYDGTTPYISKLHHVAASESGIPYNYPLKKGKDGINYFDQELSALGETRL